MAIPKIATQLPMVKRVTLKKKVKFTGKVAKLVTKAGKKIDLPAKNVLVATANYCQYLMPQKKLIKGDFSYNSKKGFYICEDTGDRVNPDIMIFGEEKPPMTAKQKKAAKKKAEAMKKAREKGKKGKKTTKKKKKSS